jgi:hypothetical protein
VPPHIALLLVGFCVALNAAGSLSIFSSRSRCHAATALNPLR